MPVETEWQPWFAWKPAWSLYTKRTLWLVWVSRRTTAAGHIIYREARFRGLSTDWIVI